MINAIEVRIARSAKDETEARRTQAQLYAPPKDQQGPRRRTGGGLSLAEAKTLAMEVATEDASLTRARR